MPKIAQYFATGKLTPSDIGFQGFETAARRIGASAEQTATGERQLGQDIAKLWDVAGRIEGEKFATGGGGGVKQGSGKVSNTLLGTGAGGDTNFNARANAANAAADTGTPAYLAFQAAAHKEISRAAPALVNAATAATTAISPTPTADTTLLRGGQPTPTADTTILRGGQPPPAPLTADQIAARDLAPDRVGAATTILRPGQTPQISSYPTPRGAVIETPDGFARRLPPGAIGAEVLPGSIGPSRLSTPLPNAGNAGADVTPRDLKNPDTTPVETTVSPAIADPSWSGPSAMAPAVRQNVLPDFTGPHSTIYLSGPGSRAPELGERVPPSEFPDAASSSGYVAPAQSTGASVWQSINDAVSVPDDYQPPQE